MHTQSSASIYSEPLIPDQKWKSNFASNYQAAFGPISTKYSPWATAQIIRPWAKQNISKLNPEIDTEKGQRMKITLSLSRK